MWRRWFCCGYSTGSNCSEEETKRRLDSLDVFINKCKNRINELLKEQGQQLEEFKKISRQINEQDIASISRTVLKNQARVALHDINRTKTLLAHEEQRYRINCAYYDQTREAYENIENDRQLQEIAQRHPLLKAMKRLDTSSSSNWFDDVRDMNRDYHEKQSDQLVEIKDESIATTSDSVLEEDDEELEKLIQTYATPTTHTEEPDWRALLPEVPTNTLSIPITPSTPKNKTDKLLNITTTSRSMNIA